MVKFRNLYAAAAKPMADRFGLIQEGADLSWIENVTPAPSFNDLTPYITGGGSAQFELSVDPGSQPGSVQLVWNGVELFEGVGYTRTGTTITMADGYAPQPGYTLVARVWGSVEGTVTSGGGSGGSGTQFTASMETPTGTVDGVNAAFTLTVAPSLAQVYLNGQLQAPTVDYLLADRVITFQAGSIPQTGDALLVYILG